MKILNNDDNLYNKLIKVSFVIGFSISLFMLCIIGVIIYIGKEVLVGPLSVGLMVISGITIIGMVIFYYTNETSDKNINKKIDRTELRNIILNPKTSEKEMMEIMTQYEATIR